MSSLESSSIDRSMRLVYDLHEININDCETTNFVSEGLEYMGMCCHNIALHSIRVSNYSATIGKRLGLSTREIKQLWCASIFHDVGKSSIPAEILEKPAKLTEEEYEVVKTHSHKGYELVKRNKAMKEVSDIILYHHERFDGKGYPTGKERCDIPLLSRIIAVADAFDAMTSERPYRMPLSLDSALTELKKGKWTQFDGYIVDCFVDLMEGNCLETKELNIAFGLI